MIAVAEKKYVDLPVEEVPGGPKIEIPVNVVKGLKTGPTLAVFGAVHGDEFEGVQAIIEVTRELDPTRLAGTFVGVPVSNPLAYSAGTRETPNDGKNLARIFPGRPEGTITERIAHVLYKSVISQVQYLIDLHSAGTRYAMLPHAQYRLGSKASKESSKLAEIFGTEIVYGIAALPGRMTSVAVQLGIPCVEPEMRGEGRCLREFVQIDKRGITNIMKHLHMVEGEPELSLGIECIETPAGTSSGEVVARRSGLLTSHVELGARVAKNRKLATVTDLHGNEIETIYATFDGIVYGIRTFQPVSQGEVIFYIGNVRSTRI